MTLERYLRTAAQRLAGSDTPQLDARVLAKHALGLDDAGLIVGARRDLTEAEIATLDALVARRAAGEPVAYIVGEKEFFGLTFKTAPGVLVPRPDSETLVEAALALRPDREATRILDLGAGTGCLLLALLAQFPAARGVGIDINPAAVRLARENAAALGLSGRALFVAGDWGAPLDGRFDIIVSNPPYIREAARASLAPDVRDHEDPRALFGGPDGLDALRAVLAAAARLATETGLIIIEIGADQEEEAKALAQAVFPERRIGIRTDLAGRARGLIIGPGGK